MKKIAIITARGGSKRIPGKNIRPFSGKPIMAYSIEAALESGIFDEVMVSTEDKRIAELAKQLRENEIDSVTGLYVFSAGMKHVRERRGTLPGPTTCCWRCWKNTKGGESVLSLAAVFIPQPLL